MSAELAAPAKSMPQAGVGKSPIPLCRTLGWRGVYATFVRIGKYPRSGAGLSKTRKEIRICKSRGTADSPRHSSPRKGDEKGCP